ncbi:MAG TPA: DEAD/DEAH box helicase [Opitutales bacterium]|nr:DEAD/DEAH box helicase [Opitutales bacterium]
MERERDVGRLKDLLAPYILRRTKDKVAPELPEKIEQVVYCPLNEEQASAYESIRSKGERRISDMESRGDGESSIRMAAFTELLRMRQFCADPRLVDPSFAVLGSSKWEAFREILFACMDDGHRILVFSQFVSMLSILRDELDKLGVGYCYIDGQTVNRLAEADRFNNEPGIPLFLISLKAGGTGLNLTGADTVIHYDPWWNPAVEAQATDRAHRIGQSRVVTSIRLVVADSVEERVQQMQQRKRAFLQELFEASDASSAKVSLKDMRDLMGSGVQQNP